MTQPTASRTVRCPTCGGDSAYAPGNRWRPFCSERCKQGDLGAWASEQYALPDKGAPTDDWDAEPR